MGTSLQSYRVAAENGKLCLPRLIGIIQLSYGVSLEESSRLLDSLLPLPEDASMEDWYMVMIEKIYNLTLATRLSEALVLTKAMAEKCAVQGSSRVRAWLECYLTVIYFIRVIT